ncbi:transaldolase family protein [Chromobacterium subtsugae]|uniref:transaldolase family protein n=1 Tax=Chromobacterium subtsugae TaxID=251747 RepID=UPI000640D0D1|nr:transaldolase family protein [Chromobacterium subtsugae]
MKIWLDTIDFDIIRNAQALGVLAGVTTNPAILAAADLPAQTVIETLLDIQDGQVAAQVTRDDLPGMLAQARALARISPRMVIKIPAIRHGFQAIATLEKEGIATLATTIFETRQILMAGMVGASYAAPYVNRIEQSTGNAFAILSESQAILERYRYKTIIMAAAIKSVEQCVRCAQFGIGAATLPSDIYRGLFASNHDIDDSLAKFDAAWAASKFTSGSSLFHVPAAKEARL